MTVMFLGCVAAACLTLQEAEPLAGSGSEGGQGSAGFRVEQTLEVGAAPHGIQFSRDGSEAYVAVSGDDEIAVLDCATHAVLRRLPAGAAPLDMVALGRGDTLVTTQFSGASLIRVALAGGASDEPDDAWEVGRGPSFFGPRVVDDVAYLSCEHADRLVLFDTRSGYIREQFETGAQPYPADVTRDGVLAFVPNRGDSTVTVIDLLNGEVLATVPVGANPEGGALLEDDTAYVVACGGDDELVWINTASFEVEQRTTGVGPRPFSVATTPDGRFALVNNSGGSTLSIVDVASRSVVGELEVGEQPIAVRMHPDGRRAYVSCERAGTVSVISLPEPPEPPAQLTSGAKNQVVVIGTIHGGHRTSALYGLDLLRELVRAVAPDYVLTEIPPNRAREAMRGFLADGQVSESRVSRFPEYVDVLYPLLAELEFEIVPTAGWSEPMARFRSQRLAEIAADPARAADWQAYTEANAASDACLAEHGAGDDPRFIHSAAYDDCNDVGLAVYDELFNAELGPGGWTNINEAHYGHIAAALDRHRGAGKRFLVTYGAGHKGWFLRELRKRDDIELLVLDPFLDDAEAALSGR